MPRGLAALLLCAPVRCSDTVIPVHTDLSPAGFAEEDDSGATREQIRAAFNLSYVPAFSRRTLAPGGAGWRGGDDVVVAAPPRGGAASYAFVFLHGAGERSADASIRRWVGGLLAALPGTAVLPQALPGFDMDLFFPRARGDMEQPGVNSFRVANYSMWTSIQRPSPFACYADPAAEDPMWPAITEEHYRRVRAYIRGFLRGGVAPGNVFVVGFSIGAVMAQQVAARIAAEDGVLLGGGIGLDGADVDHIASRSVLRRIPGRVPALYFMYSSPPRVADAEAACLTSYPGFDMQLLRVEEDSEVVPHAVYPELLPCVVRWIRAPNRTRAAAAVRAAWERGMREIRAGLPPAPRR